MIIEISDSTESTDSEPDSDQTLDKFLKSIQSSQSTLNPTAQVVLFIIVCETAGPNWLKFLKKPMGIWVKIGI